ncbi:hypothetical protein RF11_05822 [Thelohanellus kitauei]|uniref:Uncharacterized protein n=1 Tax=Thelohanellus kitauei TaxID=669202 RepID=A0A0C2M9X6_THEKT|nr:hypothetical protein RF11_05822 [Thelohanellus kitauei]
MFYLYSLLFGIEVVLSGFIGAIVPSLLISKFNGTKGRLEALICVTTSFMGAVFSFLTIITSAMNFYAMWFCLLIALVNISSVFLPQAELLVVCNQPLKDDYRPRFYFSSCWTRVSAYSRTRRCH